MVDKANEQLDILEKKGAFIRRVGSAEEEVVFDLASLVGEKLDYLSLLIVRKNGNHRDIQE